MSYYRRGRALRQFQPTLPSSIEDHAEHVMDLADARREAGEDGNDRPAFYGERGGGPIRPGSPHEYERGEPLLVEEWLGRVR